MSFVTEGCRQPPMMCTFDGAAGAAGAATPGWLTVIVFPAARMVPDRLVPVPFALTV